MKISRQDVLRVAELAQLELTSQEVETYSGQLDAILTYIDKLNELDISHVEPMAQVLVQSETNGGMPGGFSASADPNPALRNDVEKPCHSAEAVLKIAPDPSGPYFRVPRVIER
jgi:aspartyl-tRNA(Asn)/glutamyl-tRNA(Gln) amidotransferase subunit C